MPHHIHLLHFLLKRELRELYISMAIKSFALSMVSVFVPVYLLTKTSLTLTGVLFFFLLSCIVFILAIPIATAIASVYGLKHGIALSAPFYILLYALLSFVTNYNITTMILLASALGIADAIFWISLHVDLARASDKKNRGGEIGALYTFSVLAKVAGPLIGGAILTFFSFSALFIVASAAYMLSLVPLSFSHDKKANQPVSSRNLIQIFVKNKRRLLTSLFYGTFNVGEVILWPLFLFAFLHIYLEFGMVFTIAEILMAVSYSVLGEISDHYSKTRVLKTGNILFALVWILRYYIPSITFLLMSIPFAAIILPAIQIPFMSLNYEAARKSRNLAAFIALQQFFTNLGRAVFLLFLIAANSLEIGFLGLAASSLIHALFP